MTGMPGCLFDEMKEDPPQRDPWVLWMLAGIGQISGADDLIRAIGPFPIRGGHVGKRSLGRNHELAFTP